MKRCGRDMAEAAMRARGSRAAARWGGLAAVGLMMALGAEAAGAATKWNPGHYAFFVAWNQSMLPSDADITAALQQPGLRGVQIGVPWRLLEPTKGAYSFSQIDHYLDLVDNYPNKYLVIQFFDRCFGCNQTGTFPDYLINEGYVASRGAGEGYIAKIWTAYAMDREIAVVQRLGSRYNAHPRFEGLVFPETALGASFDPAAYKTQLKRLAVAAKAAFPGTLVWQNMNWLGNSRAEHEANFNELLTHHIPRGMGAGWPDTRSPDCTPQLPFLHWVLPDYGNQFPRFASMQLGPLRDCLEQLGGDAPANVVAWLYDYALNTAKAHHISWSEHATDPPYNFWSQAVPYLNAHPTTFTTCPSNIICSAPTVTLTAPDATAHEAGQGTGRFQITRTGSTTSSLTVTFSRSGSAAQSDFTPNPLGTTKTIPAGASSATITLTPVNDTANEVNETVTLTLVDGAAYNLGAPASATVTIVDND